MCSNLTLRQKLLPLYMKASNEQEAAAATMMETTQEPPPMTSMPPAPSVSESSAMPAFRHPSLNRSTHRHISQYAPTPMYHSMDSVPSASAPVPPPVSTPVAVGAVPPSASVASPVETTSAPSTTRSFGLAGKGPRVVAGVSRPTANRITKYNPHVGVASNPVPLAAESAPLPTPIAPIPAASTPLPTPVAPIPTASTPLPTPVASQSTPEPIPAPFTPSTSKAPMVGSQKPLVKPKPAKP